MDKKLLIISLLFPLFLTVSGQKGVFNINNQNISSYYKTLYNYEFNNTPGYLKEIENQCDQSSYFLLDVNYLWWMIITGEQENENIEKCFELLDTAELFFNGNLDIDTKTSIVNQLIIQLFKARIHIFDNNYGRALIGYSKMLNFLKQLIDIEENFVDDDIKLILGLYNYSIGKMKSRYPLFLPYFAMLPKSDYALGKRLMLESLKSESVIIKTETLYFLMKISLEVDEDYESAILFSNQLTKLYPDNLLFLFYEFRINLLNNQFYEARIVANKIGMLSESLEGLTPRQRTHFVNLVNIDIEKYGTTQ